MKEFRITFRVFSLHMFCWKKSWTSKYLKQESLQSSTSTCCNNPHELSMLGYTHTSTQIHDWLLLQLIGFIFSYEEILKIIYALALLSLIACICNKKCIVISLFSFTKTEINTDSRELARCNSISRDSWYDIDFINTLSLRNKGYILKSNSCLIYWFVPT